MNSLTQEISEHLSVFFDKILSFIPDFLVMLIILAAGFVTAAAVKMALTRIFRAVDFDGWSDAVGVTSALRRTGMEARPSMIITVFTYWLTVVMFFMAGLGSLGLPAASSIASVFFHYLPKLLSAIPIFIIGYLFAGFLGRAALLAGVNAGVEYSKTLGEAVRLLILVLVAAMVLEQLAIAPRIVYSAFSIFFGSISLALALAFGLGGRNAAKRIIEDLRKKKEKNDLEPL